MSQVVSSTRTLPTTSLSRVDPLSPEPQFVPYDDDIYEPSQSESVIRSGYNPKQTSLREAVCRSQAAPRLNMSRNVRNGSAAGSAAGTVAFIAAAAPTAGLSLLCIPIGAGIGALLGTKRNRRAPTESFGIVRKHVFSDAGVVSSRDESERVVKLLKHHYVLSRGRDRRIANLERLDFLSPGDLGVNDLQFGYLKQVLVQIANEAELYDRMVNERTILSYEVERLDKTGHNPNAATVQARLAYLEGALINFPYRYPSEAYANGDSTQAAVAAGIELEGDIAVLTEEQRRVLKQRTYQTIKV